ncbi:MAG: hypothetical protein HY690_02235 [Chloroflexi bacterium]|nr:hypothetical protein [Chloroflexota bacterium]
MANIPVAIPDVPVLWHNAVVDIEPTSRYGLDRDLSSINSTLCYVNPSAEPLALALLAPSQAETECNVRRQSREQPVHQEAQALDPAPYRPVLAALAAGGWNTGALERILERSPRHFVGGARLEPGPQVVRFHTRVPIPAGADGIRELALAVPMSAGPLSQGAALSIVVLLPNDAPEYQVEVVDWSVESEPGAQVWVYGSEGRPKLAGRPALAWSWVRGPFVGLKYRYRATRGRGDAGTRRPSTGSG